MLQTLMSDPRWQGFEAFFQDFMERNFIQTSLKRDTEFDTLWYAAASEGAKMKLLEFKKLMEEEASQV